MPGNFISKNRKIDHYNFRVSEKVGGFYLQTVLTCYQNSRL